MRSAARKGLQDIRTRSSLSGELENPQRKFLRAASLELKKSLCRKVRDAAKKRTEEMEEKIAELDDEQARLLAASQLSQPEETDSRAASAPAGEAGSQQPHGFALKY
jgi:DNA-binding protein H-NS